MKKLFFFFLLSIHFHATAVRVHCITHTPFQKLRVIKAWAQENNHTVSVTRSYVGEQLPDVSTFDFLIITGGPQNIWEIEKFPYLYDEIEFIERAIAHQKCVLGICLGMQLLSETLGAHIEKSPNKEIGFFPIELTEAGKQDPVFEGLPHKMCSFHWHAFMAGLPADAVVLATSGGCPRQAIRFTDRVYGFQFHMEAIKDSLVEFLGMFYDDEFRRHMIQTKEAMILFDLMVMSFFRYTPQRRYIQSPDAILGFGFNQMNERFKLMLTRIVEVGVGRSI